MASISPLRAVVPAIAQISNPYEFFSAAKKKFTQYLEDGYYAQTGAESLFIYRVQRAHRSHTGVLACANVLDYIEGNIKKHENTLTAKEDKMLGLFYERNAMIKPILLTYPNAMEIDALINRLTIALPPSFTIPFGDETHVFWQITDPATLHHLVVLFQNHVPTTYICDGHHRAASSERMYKEMKESGQLTSPTDPYNFMLAAYFPVSEIEVHNYNRYVVSLPLPMEEFFQQMGEVFYITPQKGQSSPTALHQIGMYAQKRWYKLEFKETVLPNIKKSSIKERLDVELLNQLVLKGLLGVQDVREDHNIQYLEAPEGLAGIENKVNANGLDSVGFAMYPVALEDLMAIANADGTMPPKSTWIEPRMRNGFVVQIYE